MVANNRNCFRLPNVKPRFTHEQKLFKKCYNNKNKYLDYTNQRDLVAVFRPHITAEIHATSYEYVERFASVWSLTTSWKSKTRKSSEDQAPTYLWNEMAIGEPYSSLDWLTTGKETVSNRDCKKPPTRLYHSEDHGESMDEEDS